MSNSRGFTTLGRLLVAVVVLAFCVTLFNGCGGGTNTGGGGGSQTTPMATPVVNPATSTLTTSSTSVTLTDATAGATIYYTTDGTTPTTASAKYSAPFPMACPDGAVNAITIKAYAPAIDVNHTDSPSASATYTFQVPVATPTISPAAGNIAAGTTVTITDATSGATIYYTVDGSTPSVSTIKYVGPFTVNTSETVKALAVGYGASYTNSAIASATYTVVQNPTIQAGTLATAVLLNTGSVELQQHDLHGYAGIPDASEFRWRCCFHHVHTCQRMCARLPSRFDDARTDQWNIPVRHHLYGDRRHWYDTSLGDNHGHVDDSINRNGYGTNYSGDFAGRKCYRSTDV